MYSPLIPIKIDSIYNGPLPRRMALCTPDMYAAVFALKTALKSADSDLVLSDMYRSYDMQLQAHMDYVSKKKKAFSPPPGGSMHEAGRAIDIDLSWIRKLTLPKFWPIATEHGFTPIINTPDSKISEAWHFDCRGSHGAVYDYYKSGKGDNFSSPYTAMAASGIISTGQSVDALGKDIKAAYVQSGLIRLGQNIGDLDGVIGVKAREGLRALNIDPKLPTDDLTSAIDDLLQKKFPDEFFVAGATIAAGQPPAHLAAMLIS